MRTVVVGIGVICAIGWGSAALACHSNPTCTVGGVTYRCDQCQGGLTGCFPTGNDVCPGKCNSNPTTVCLEDSDCPLLPNMQADHCNYVGDGVSTWCYGDGNDVVAATIPNQVLCTNGGNDIVLHVYNVAYKVNLGPGDDQVVATTIVSDDFIEGGTGSDRIDAGPGNDTIYGNTSTNFTGDGNNRLAGGDGNDAIFGGDGHDRLFGGNGNDFLFGQGGRDVLKGGAGNDILFTANGVTPANSILGTILCGDDGDDLLIANGPGHQCMNAGPGQAVSGSESDCFYGNAPLDGDDHDIGSVKRCLAPSGGPLLTDIPCGCNGEDIDP